MAKEKGKSTIFVKGKRKRGKMDTLLNQPQQKSNKSWKMGYLEGLGKGRDRKVKDKEKSRKVKVEYEKYMRS